VKRGAQNVRGWFFREQRRAATKNKKMQPPEPHTRTQRAAVPPRTVAVIGVSFSQNKGFVLFFCHEWVTSSLLLSERLQVIKQGSEIIFAQHVD
jgi:hypothetical protein